VISGFPGIVDAEFGAFGDKMDASVRAQELDEGLDILAAL
jgi:hypothetical protein